MCQPLPERSRRANRWTTCGSRRMWTPSPRRGEQRRSPIPCPRFSAGPAGRRRLTLGRNAPLERIAAEGEQKGALEQARQEGASARKELDLAQRQQELALKREDMQRKQAEAESKIQVARERAAADRDNAEANRRLTLASRKLAALNAQYIKLLDQRRALVERRAQSHSGAYAALDRELEANLAALAAAEVEVQALMDEIDAMGVATQPSTQPALPPFKPSEWGVTPGRTVTSPDGARKYLATEDDGWEPVNG
mgnify:CR=1 FL=1